MTNQTNKIIIDTRGHECPKPIIMVKKSFNQLNTNSILEILTDNQISLENLLRFLKDNGFMIEVICSTNFWIINAHASNTIPESNNLNVKEYCSITTPQKTISNTGIVIKSDQMGLGSEELGKVLLKGFLNTISESDLLPSQIIFYNSGVLLCQNNSPVIEHLKKLISNNVKIIICGTCVDYFGIKDNINIGTISNMFNICEILNSANKIIYP